MKRLTTEGYLTKAQNVWGTRWDYSGTEYIRATEKLSIVCPLHGEFHQIPAAHLRGQVGCTECSGWKKSEETFLREAQRVWGDRWDYKETVYARTATPVDIICPLHGTFQQTPKKHLAGQIGCPRCNGQHMDAYLFASKAREIWGNRWNYSKVEYVRTQDKVTIVCIDHGEFLQSPNSHLNGSVSCPGCLGGVPGVPLTQEGFIRRAEGVWSGRWDYTPSEYKGSKTKLTITCPNHGQFQQPPDSHFLGRVGCTKCSNSGTSRLEGEVADFIESLGFKVSRNVRGLLGDTQQELDVFVEDSKIAVEFNGLYYHSENFRPRDYHFRKWEKSKDSGIKLLQVWEDDWVLKREIVENHLRQVFGVSDLPKVAARKIIVEEVHTHVAREFLGKYHIQGFASATSYLGAFYLGTLVGLASFKKSGADYVLVRYATSVNLQGGHSKLVTYFEKSRSYENLVTFSDLSFGSGDLYNRTGWTMDSILPPDYSYIVNGRREHKFGYRLEKFRRDPRLTYVEGATERQLASLNNLTRIYDTGKIRYLKSHPTSGA